jgi:hypothetical protein
MNAEPIIHFFPKSKEKSLEAMKLPFWEKCYKEYFPDMSIMVSHEKYGYWQNEGVDRSITFDSAKQILIEEKVRWRAENGKVYEDIALEYWSDKKRRKEGWVCKPLRADFIAYAIAPLGVCYLLPVIQLQKAWKQYGEMWIDKFVPPIRCVNSGYVSESVGVPPDVLFEAMGYNYKTTFTPVEKP